MIVVNVALMQKKLIELVTAIEEPKIEFVSQKGLEVYFKSEDEAQAAEIAKKVLKATPEFKTVYFQVHIK